VFGHIMGLEDTGILGPTTAVEMAIAVNLYDKKIQKKWIKFHATLLASNYQPCIPFAFPMMGHISCRYLSYSDIIIFFYECLCVNAALCLKGLATHEGLITTSGVGAVAAGELCGGQKHKNQLLRHFYRLVTKNPSNHFNIQHTIFIIYPTFKTFQSCANIFTTIKYSILFVFVQIMLRYFNKIAIQ
ncbi:hypothetical protein ACJX0J_040621, partial [Zea mays]